MKDIAPWLIIFAGGYAYFLPTIIARGRQKMNIGAIAALNVLTGWSVVGWVVALIWALTKDPATTGKPDASVWEYFTAAIIFAMIAFESTQNIVGH